MQTKLFHFTFYKCHFPHPTDKKNVIEKNRYKNDQCPSIIFIILTSGAEVFGAIFCVKEASKF